MKAIVRTEVQGEPDCAARIGDSVANLGGLTGFSQGGRERDGYERAGKSMPVGGCLTGGLGRPSRPLHERSVSGSWFIWGSRSFVRGLVRRPSAGTTIRRKRARGTGPLVRPRGLSRTVLHFRETSREGLSAILRVQNPKRALDFENIRRAVGRRT